MVDLVDVLVELGVMKEPVHKGISNINLKNHVIDSETTIDVNTECTIFTLKAGYTA